MSPHGAVETATHAASNFQIIVALSIFILTYGVVLTEKVNRAIVSLLGGSLMVLSGIITQNQAIAAIDFNTIFLLLGMMIVVTVTKESGVFQYVAIWSAQKVKANAAGVLIMLSAVTAVFSGLLDNVTTVLLITPVTLLITKELGVKPYPYLFASILSSNIGGAATLIGDPPNIMIGSAVGLSFNDFLVNVAPITFVVAIFTMIPILLIWRKDLVSTDKNRAHIMQMKAGDAITDKGLLIKAMTVMAMIVFGFTIGHNLWHIQPATVALGGAALLLLLDNIQHDSEKQHERVHHAIAEAEWVTLFFFMGLFMVIYGIEHVGVINWLAGQMLEFTGGDFHITAMTILWGSAVISALVDNIPFVATMIPMIQTMGDTFGGHDALLPLWWALSLGACLGGNGSLIGASANLVVAGFAERAGQGISFLKFMAAAFPLMLMSIAIAHVYLEWRYL